MKRTKAQNLLFLACWRAVRVPCPKDYLPQVRAAVNYMRPFARDDDEGAWAELVRAAQTFCVSPEGRAEIGAMHEAVKAVHALFGKPEPMAVGVRAPWYEREGLVG